MGSEWHRLPLPPDGPEIVSGGRVATRSVSLRSSTVPAPAPRTGSPAGATTRPIGRSPSSTTYTIVGSRLASCTIARSSLSASLTTERPATASRPLGPRTARDADRSRPRVASAPGPAASRNPFRRPCVRGPVDLNPHAPEPVDDRELIGRVLAGDPGAERELYDAHVDRVFRLVYRMAGDPDRAQDYTQETFIRAFRRLADFRGESALSTWLCSIAISVTLNGLRRLRAGPRAGGGAGRGARDRQSGRSRPTRTSRPGWRRRSTACPRGTGRCS